MSDALRAIELARKELSKPHYDPYVAVALLMLCPEVKAANLDDLAWSLYKDGSVSKNDVVGLIEALEKYLKEAQA